MAWTEVYVPRDADLLIHEAYGVAGDTEQAHTFGHSTSTDAGKAALAAGAKRLILTHLRASRYADPDLLLEEARAIFDGPAEVARDLETFDF